MWCGDALNGLGIQGVELLIFLDAFILPSMAPASQQNFLFMEFTLSASAL
jgi:hypothetical protein